MTLLVLANPNRLSVSHARSGYQRCYRQELLGVPRTLAASIRLRRRRTPDKWQTNRRAKGCRHGVHTRQTERVLRHVHGNKRTDVMCRPGPTRPDAATYTSSRTLFYVLTIQKVMNGVEVRTSHKSCHLARLLLLNNIIIKCISYAWYVCFSSAFTRISLF